MRVIADLRDPKDARTYEQRVAEAHRERMLEEFWRNVQRIRQREWEFDPMDRDMPAFLRRQAV